MNKLLLFVTIISGFATAPLATAKSPRPNTQYPVRIELIFTSKNAAPRVHRLSVAPDGIDYNSVRITSHAIPYIGRELGVLLRPETSPPKTCYAGLYEHRVIRGKGRPVAKMGCLNSDSAARLFASLRRLQSLAATHREVSSVKRR